MSHDDASKLAETSEAIGALRASVAAKCPGGNSDPNAALGVDLLMVLAAIISVVMTIPKGKLREREE